MTQESPIDPSEYTVDDLGMHVETTDYSVEELRAIRAAETDDVAPRSTAIDAIDEELDALTSGPTTDSTDEEDDDAFDYSKNHINGGGATGMGSPGVELPDPYADDAPASLRITLDVAMAVGGVMFDEDGEKSISYATPNDEGVSGMRVKRTLESDTNTARLSTADPNHPDNQ